MLVHASIDENKKISGGKAGDQTSKEVCTRAYYSKPWNIMLRCKDSKLAIKAANIALKLANSNLVGYDQSQRNTLYKELKKHNFDVDAYIKSGVKTETDCSAFMFACYACIIASMRIDSNAPTTSTMRNYFKKYGFEVFTDSKYLTTDNYLQVGDVLVSEGHHTVMNTTTGAKVIAVAEYFPKCNATIKTISDGLESIGVDSGKSYRTTIAKKNGILGYTGTAEQNAKMLKLLKDGKMLKP